MARLAYYAPGVYVEEIPSARQPIAGVGTNTVGFIGIVPSKIYRPEPSPSYDPMLAKTLLDYRQAVASSQPASSELARLTATQASLREQVARLDSEITRLQADATSSTTAVTEAQTRLDAAQAATPSNPADVNAAQTALTTAQRAAARAARALTAATERQEEARRNLDNLSVITPAPAGGAAPAPAPAPTAGAGAAPATPAAPTAPSTGEEDDDYMFVDPDADMLRPSMFRPYYFKEFQVKVDEFDTKLCTNFSEYVARFGDYSGFKPEPEDPSDDPAKWVFKPMYRGHHLLTHAVAGFFANGGTKCFVARVDPKNIANWTKALEQFKSIEDVSILAAPGLPKKDEIWEELETYCEDPAHQNVFAILDSPATIEDDENDLDIKRLGYDSSDPLLPRKSTHAAYYFPHIEVVDPAKRLQDSDPARSVVPKYRGRTYVPPSGHIAGIYARTDEERGVHKAPANATVRGALEVKDYVSKPMQELLNPQGVNCIRLMNGDVTVWGARNIGGDSLGEWKYINVRRFAGFLEESIERGTQWIVFEPNDPNLWSRIILNITAFLTNVWRSGALFGLTPQEAFYVKCDAELNPPEVRDLGQVITEIGVAIVRPAEFVIFRITQSTGAREG